MLARGRTRRTCLSEESKYLIAEITCSSSAPQTRSRLFQKAMQKWAKFQECSITIDPRNEFGAC